MYIALYARFTSLDADQACGEKQGNSYVIAVLDVWCSTILHTIRLGGLRRRSLSVEFFLSFSFSGEPFYGHKIPLTDKPLRK